MPIFHFGRRGLLVAGATLGISGTLPAYGANDQAAIVPIQRLVVGLLSVMKAGPGTPFTQRYEMLASVIDRTFDLAAILQESVGPAWLAFPQGQQQMLMEAFRRYTVASYVNSFDNYNGQRIEVSPDTRVVGANQIVQTRIIPVKGETHELDYVMRNAELGWRAVDVLADGTISRVAVQRSDFRRLLGRGGPQALADTLRAKSTDLSDGSS